MKVMVFVKATKESEAGKLPSQELLAEMGKFNEELVKAGVMLAGEGLQPSSKGARVKFSGKQRMVTDGPFTETKELIAGFWLWEVASLQEAIDWVKRCPNPHEGESEIEIRQVFTAEDFGDGLHAGAQRARREAARPGRKAQRLLTLDGGWGRSRLHPANFMREHGDGVQTEDYDVPVVR